MTDPSQPSRASLYRLQALLTLTPSGRAEAGFLHDVFLNHFTCVATVDTLAFCVPEKEPHGLICSVDPDRETGDPSLITFYSQSENLKTHLFYRDGMPCRVEPPTPLTARDKHVLDQFYDALVHTTSPAQHVAQRMQFLLCDN